MELPIYASLADKLLLLLSMYAAMFLYSGRMERRKSRAVLFAVCFAATVSICFLAEVARKYINFGVFSLVTKNAFDIFILLACVVSMGLIRRVDRSSGLFIACAAYATICLANNIFALFTSFFVGPTGILGAIGAAKGLAVRAGIFLVTYAAVFAFCWRMLLKQRTSLNYAVDKSVYAIILLIFLINLFVGNFDDGRTYLIILFGKILFCLLILAVLFRQAKYLNLREEHARLQVMMEQQKSQYALAKENIDQVNIKAHDIKHFLDIFRSSGEMPADFLATLDTVYQQYENIYDTGNKALNITLTEKTRSFADDHIEFSVIADGTALSFMSDVDIYVLFGNILDNAREAVMGIADEQNRIIGLYLRQTEQGIALHAENTFARRPIFSGGLPQTSKSDEVNHGFGTKSIQAVVDKYGGNLLLDCDDQLFTVNIVFFTSQK